MKALSLIAILLIVCFTSCDGKHRMLETHKEKLENSTLSKSFFEKDIYIPESYIESVTDTILTSNVRVKVKYYSLTNELVSSKIKDNKNQIVTTHYREFESEIHVFKNDKLVFKDILNKSNFATSQDSDFWEKAILQYVWLDESESTIDHLSFNCSFLDSSTKAYRTYKVYFNNLGKREIELIETS